MGRGAWQAAVHGVTKVHGDTTEQLTHIHTHTHTRVTHRGEKGGGTYFYSCFPLPVGQDGLTGT